MLINFSCANYLSFKDEITLSMLAAKPIKDFQADNVFDTDRHSLLKSAVLYGANASGKSNLIKAMGKMKSLVINSSKDLQKDEPLRIAPFRLSTATLKEPSRFDILIIEGNKKYRYGFELDDTEIKREWLYVIPKIKEMPLFLREGGDIEVFGRFKEGKGLEERTRNNALFLSVCAQFNGEIAGEVLQWFTNFNVISGAHTEFYQRITEDMFLKNAEIRRMITDFVKEADLGIADIAIERKKPDQHKIPPIFLEQITEIFMKGEVLDISSLHNIYDDNGERSGSTRFNFESDESDGTKKYFSLSGPILDTLNRGNILVIDELDASLHPLLTREIVRLFNSGRTNPNNAQLIFTTHETNLLTSVKFRRDQIWFCEKNQQEATDLYSLAEYKMPRKDASFEKDYIKGRYGAIPFLGDFMEIWGK